MLHQDDLMYIACTTLCRHNDIRRHVTSCHVMAEINIQCKETVSNACTRLNEICHLYDIRRQKERIYGQEDGRRQKGITSSFHDTYVVSMT